MVRTSGLVLHLVPYIHFTILCLKLNSLIVVGEDNLISLHKTSLSKPFDKYSSATGLTIINSFSKYHNCVVINKIKKGHILSYHGQKREKKLKKIYFWYFKVPVSTRTQTENFQYMGFLNLKKKKICGSLTLKIICKHFCRFGIL